MAEKKRIALKYLPPRLPLWSSLAVWLTLDRYQPPGWVYGAVGLFFALAWLACIVDIATYEPTRPKDI